jgi:hypothetical protein
MQDTKQCLLLIRVSVYGIEKLTQTVKTTPHIDKEMKINLVLSTVNFLLVNTSRQKKGPFLGSNKQKRQARDCRAKLRV